MSRLLISPTKQIAQGQIRHESGPLKIDWTNPLTRNLEACFLPGATGIVDICGKQAPLTSSSPTPGVTPDGVGVATVGPASAYSGSVVNASTVGGDLTLFWRGLQVSNAPGANSGQYIDIPTSGSGSFIGVLFVNGNGTGNWDLAWNHGGTFLNVNTTTQSAAGYGGKIVTLCGVIPVGGTCILYRDGNNIGSKAFGAGSPTVTGPTMQVGAAIGASNNIITNIGMVWNRALSSTEVSQLQYNPYGFIIPAKEELPAVYLSAAAFSAKFRRTASPIGGRVGSRQSWAA